MIGSGKIEGGYKKLQKDERAARSDKDRKL